jgi:hypothetical protein
MAIGRAPRRPGGAPARVFDVLCVKREDATTPGIRAEAIGDRLRWVPDSQTAGHRSDDDFELCGCDPVGGDVCLNHLQSQLQKLVSVQGLAHGMFQSNALDGAMIASSRHESDTSCLVNKVDCVRHQRCGAQQFQATWGTGCQRNQLHMVLWAAAGPRRRQPPDPLDRPTSLSPRIPPATSSLPRDKSTERIDGIGADIMAIGRAMVAQDEPQPEYSMFFV